MSEIEEEKREQTCELQGGECEYQDGECTMKASAAIPSVKDECAKAKLDGKEETCTQYGEAHGIKCKYTPKGTGDEGEKCTQVVDEVVPEIPETGYGIASEMESEDDELGSAVDEEEEEEACQKAQKIIDDAYEKDTEITPELKMAWGQNCRAAGCIYDEDEDTCTKEALEGPDLCQGIAEHDGFGDNPQKDQKECEEAGCTYTEDEEDAWCVQESEAPPVPPVSIKPDPKQVAKVASERERDQAARIIQGYHREALKKQAARRSARRSEPRQQRGRSLKRRRGDLPYLQVEDVNSTEAAFDPRQLEEDRTWQQRGRSLSRRRDESPYQDECADIIPKGFSKWTSSDGYDCAAWEEGGDWCAQYGDDEGFAAYGYTGNQACCACGGGQASEDDDRVSSGRPVSRGSRSSRSSSREEYGGYHAQVYPEEQALPPGWEQRMHEGHPYYVNQATGESTWTKPTHPTFEDQMLSGVSSTQNSRPPSYDQHMYQSQQAYEDVGNDRVSSGRPVSRGSRSLSHEEDPRWKPRDEDNSWPQQHASVLPQWQGSHAQVRPEDNSRSSRQPVRQSWNTLAQGNGRPRLSGTGSFDQTNDRRLNFAILQTDEQAAPAKANQTAQGVVINPRGTGAKSS